MELTAYDLMYRIERDQWWYRARRQLILGLVERLRVQKGAPLRILDIGCGTGLLLSELGKFGETAGIDVSSRAIEYCRTRDIGNVSVASAEQLPFDTASFDLVIMLDVLEHLPDESPALKEIRRVLHPGGTALFTVPAFMFLWSSTDIVSHHHRRYTKPEFLARLLKNGFTIERASYFNTLLFLPITLVRFLMRLIGNTTNNENTMGGKSGNWLFYNVFALEIKWLMRHSLPFGVSILAIARKPL